MDLIFGLSAGALITAAFSADVGPGFWVAGDARLKIISLGIETRLILPSKAYAREQLDISRPDKIPQELDVSTLVTNIVPCVRWTVLVGCAVLQGGLLFGARSDNPLGLDRQLGVGPRLGVEFAFFDRFAAFGFAEALFAPDQRSFVYSDFNVKWGQSVASLFVGVGFSLLFKP
jgi:hypothetical protein